MALSVLGLWLTLTMLLVVTEGAILAGLPRGYKEFVELSSRRKNFNIFYQVGKSESDLPYCTPSAVCSKVDVYDTPWVQRQCRCKTKHACSTSLDARDPHGINDKTRQFKMCEPVRTLPHCRFFRDVTWTIVTSPHNVTRHTVHCVCPKNAVAYIVKRTAVRLTPLSTLETIGSPPILSSPFTSVLSYPSSSLAEVSRLPLLSELTAGSDSGDIAYRYSFACSPQSKLRCQRKEPCRLFTVRKRGRRQEVNTSTLCQCPYGHKCPKHHRDPGVFPGKSYVEDGIYTFSAYCTGGDMEKDFLPQGSNDTH